MNGVRCLGSEANEHRYSTPLVSHVDLPLTEVYLRDCLEAFPSIRIRTTGNCMCPILAPGSTVDVASCSRRAPTLGDIVLVRQANGLRLHRLVWGPPLAPSRGWWRTAADRAPLDMPVRPEDVLGTVVTISNNRLVKTRPRRGWIVALTMTILREARLLWRGCLKSCGLP
jgi:hypothetical protein